MAASSSTSVVPCGALEPRNIRGERAKPCCQVTGRVACHGLPPSAPDLVFPLPFRPLSHHPTRPHVPGKWVCHILTGFATVSRDSRIGTRAKGTTREQSPQHHHLRSVRRPDGPEADPVALPAGRED